MPDQKIHVLVPSTDLNGWINAILGIGKEIDIKTINWSK
jgi:hypothetical protein